MLQLNLPPAAGLPVFGVVSCHVLGGVSTLFFSPGAAFSGRMQDAPIFLHFSRLPLCDVNRLCLPVLSLPLLTLEEGKRK